MVRSFDAPEEVPVFTGPSINSALGFLSNLLLPFTLVRKGTARPVMNWLLLIVSFKRYQTH